MEKTIIILRHSQIGMHGSSLTSKGNELAHKAGKKLHFLYPKASFEIWSSDNVPPKHTAMRIAEQLFVKEVFSSPILDWNNRWRIDPKKIEEMLNFIRTLKSDYILIIVRESIFKDLARKLGKPHTRKAYCCGIIMNESGSKYKPFEINK